MHFLPYPAWHRWALASLAVRTETFYVELKPISDVWDLEAQKTHRLSRAHLEQYGLEPHIAMLAFQSWVICVSELLIPVFCAMPVRYDWKYVKWYFDWRQIPNPFTQTLDGRELYRNIKRLPAYAGVPRAQIWKEFPTALPHTHNALDDALEQEEVFRQMLKAANLLK